MLSQLNIIMEIKTGIEWKKLIQCVNGIQPKGYSLEGMEASKLLVCNCTFDSNILPLLYYVIN